MTEFARLGTVEAGRRRRDIVARAPCRQEILILLVAGAAYLAFPEDLAFLAHLGVVAVLTLSLSLVLGQGGIASLGHAAFYGTGAYAAGLFAITVSADPLLGLATGALAGGAMALAAGSLILRAQGINLVMLTIAVSQLLTEVANKARGLTGGDDGLTGYEVDPILGRFGFDFYGRTAFWYVALVLVAVHLGTRLLIASPFGLTTVAIRLDRGRMLALGCRVYRHQLVLFAIGGAAAGLAGALLAQTAKVVSLDALGFGLSAEVLVMLVLGGTRRLSGAVVGTGVYMVLQHVASTANPHHWLFLIGLMLILVLVFLPGGVVELADRLLRLLQAGGRAR